MDISYLLRTGVIGWQVEARGQYAQYVQMHQLQQLLVQINSTRASAKLPEDFEFLFPAHHALQNIVKERKKKLSLDQGLQFAMMMLGVSKYAGGETNR